MNFDYIKYCQYLISSHKNYTLTNLADPRWKKLATIKLIVI